ncbi:MAG TPA: ATP-binding protein, partial [Syntrophorhabdaceae bacterium]|nr:ATP-binding protein [Syntrophorhabdaceae bacterium]
MALILIADDNAENRYVLEILLQRTGSQIVSAVNGQEAFDKACEILPDMIVSDILMPVMDGYSLCKACKADPRLRNIPFVFYTATYTEPKDIEFGLSLGAEKFLIKPMEADALLNTLTDVLTGRRTTDSEPQDPTLESEMELLKQYNETLFRKLQKKVKDLETANKMLRDEMNKRLLTEDSLRQNETRLKLLLNSLPVGFAWADKRNSVRFVNEKFTDLFGYTAEDVPCVNNSFPLSFPDETAGNAFLSTWADAIELSGSTAKPTRPLEVRVTCKNGETRDISVIGAVIEDLCLAIFTDMTEHKRLEEQLTQAQKLESIGNLAGGIAHDFNNILTSITGFAGLLQMKMDSSNPLLSHVKEVVSAGMRGAALTNQLLAFSRKQILDMKPVDLNATMAGLTKMLRRLIREDIALTINLSTTPLSVMADDNQVAQVVINLVTNARDAMPNGGSILISTEVASVDDAFIRKYGEGEIAQYALISIQDNGVGMHADIKSKIFEPFFTTKEIGKGTGLGLSVVYGIIRQHKGMIFVDSTPGKGTLFTVYLPLLKEDVEVETEPSQRLELKTGTETLLIAEDNETLRRMTK